MHVKTNLRFSLSLSPSLFQIPSFFGQLTVTSVILPWRTLKSLVKWVRDFQGLGSIFWFQSVSPASERIHSVTGAQTWHQISIGICHHVIACPSALLCTAAPTVESLKRSSCVDTLCIHTCIYVCVYILFHFNSSHSTSLCKCLKCFFSFFSLHQLLYILCICIVYCVCRPIVVFADLTSLQMRVTPQLIFRV